MLGGISDVVFVGGVCVDATLPDLTTTATLLHYAKKRLTVAAQVGTGRGKGGFSGTGRGKGGLSGTGRGKGGFSGTGHNNISPAALPLITPPSPSPRPS